MTRFFDILLPVILLALLVYYERVDTHEPKGFNRGDLQNRLGSS